MSIFNKTINCTITNLPKEHVYYYSFMYNPVKNVTFSKFVIIIAFEVESLCDNKLSSNTLCSLFLLPHLKLFFITGRRMNNIQYKHIKTRDMLIALNAKGNKKLPIVAQIL